MDSKVVIVIKTSKEVEMEVNGEKQKHLFDFEFSMPYGAPLKTANDALYDFLEEIVKKAKESMERQAREKELSSTENGQETSNEEAVS